MICKLKNHCPYWGRIGIWNQIENWNETEIRNSKKIAEHIFMECEGTMDKWVGEKHIKE